MKIIADMNIPFIKECFSSIGDVSVMSGRDMTADILSDADILLVRSITKVNAELLDKSSIRFVATATIGTDHIDTDYLNSRDIGFASAPGSNANSVAEYIVAGLLALAKKHKFQLQDKSIGIVGVGNVGSKVESKCKSLGMKVKLNDPPLERQTGNKKYLPLEELFDCDVITLHAPLTEAGQDKTFHLADEKFFNSLKPGTIFINTSRGAVAETGAIKNAIESGKLKATVLDVWENEPNIYSELILKADISTPHIAGYSYDGKVAGMIMIYNATCEHFNLKPEFVIEDFLPPSEVPEISINKIDDQQKVLHDTVQQVYAINRDDFNTREILQVPEKSRGEFFDDLRKNYPIRREFQNTTVTLDKSCEQIGEKLKGIGFKVRYE